MFYSFKSVTYSYPILNLDDHPTTIGWAGFFLVLRQEHAGRALEKTWPQPLHNQSRIKATSGTSAQAVLATPVDDSTLADDDGEFLSVKTFSLDDYVVQRL